jgi:hypothetical protein
VRYEAAEKLEIIRKAENFHMVVKRTLEKLGSRLTFYDGHEWSIYVISIVVAKNPYRSCGCYSGKFKNFEFIDVNTSTTNRFRDI